MSGKPSPEGAAAVLLMLEEIDDLETALAPMEKQLVDLTQLVTQKRERRAQVCRELGDKLDRMDCDSPGNYGWTSRYAWLLGELRRQALRRDRDRR